jgi:uridine phosphorylase
MLPILQFRLYMIEILSNKHYKEESVFLPENLLREARRQRGKKDCKVPAICLFDPDGDLAGYLLQHGRADKNECWACYHSHLYNFVLEGVQIGIIPCIVGSAYAVLVAEQLFVSGCKLLISVTSAGVINRVNNAKRFAIITDAIRDEGTSYHYLPPEQPSLLPAQLRQKITPYLKEQSCPFFEASSWTTDAPYRETQSAINAWKRQNIVCVEMEAAALYALAAVKNYNIICFAHLTNTMAQSEGDFEKGEESGSIDTLALLNYILKTPVASETGF